MYIILVYYFDVEEVLQYLPRGSSCHDYCYLIGYGFNVGFNLQRYKSEIRDQENDRRSGFRFHWTFYEVNSD